MAWIIVAIGGGVGATLRYLVQIWIAKKMLRPYWSTAAVNILGSFMFGVVSNLAIESSSLLAFITVGVLGAFTTFSTFAFELVKLIEIKQWGNALLFTGLNLLGGMIAFWLGWII